MKFLGRRSLLIGLLSLFPTFLFWVAFAPTQLGGWATYVIVDGNSMEPKFHFGDLLIVRKQAVYQVGDAVTYQNAEMGKFVFHRIVNIELDRFFLRGDNNSWLDSYHPSQGEIIGKLWIHIPVVGKGIQWVREPIHFALASSLLGGILMSGMIFPTHQRPKGKQKPSGRFGGLLEAGLYMAGFLALLFVGLSIFAFTRPLTRSTGNVQYQQEGFFFYSATATPGLYDTDKVRPGEPVFPKLTCFLNVAYAYNMTGAQVTAISGSHQLFARLLDEQSGWQRTIPLQAETAFSGSTFFSVATLDLCQVESMVSSLEQQTGLRSSVYTLEIVSQMAFTGNVAGKTVSDTFSPSLVFQFDKVHLYLPDETTGGDPLHVTKQGLVGSSEVQANTLSFLGWEPTVLVVRLLALLGLGLSLGELLILGRNLLTKARESEEALIRLKYGALLMDIHERNLELSAPVIDVASMDDLAKLAERQNTMILHMQLDFLHYYFVQVNGSAYRYISNTGKNEIVMPRPVRREIFGNLISRDGYDLVDAESTQGDLFRFPPHMDRENSGEVETVILRKIKL